MPGPARPGPPRPAYRRFWAARTISRGGDVAQLTAPALLLAPLAGPSGDHHPRLTVVTAADVVRLVVGGVLADTVGVRPVYATGGLLLIAAAATGVAAPD